MQLSKYAVVIGAFFCKRCIAIFVFCKINDFNQEKVIVVGSFSSILLQTFTYAMFFSL